MGKQVVVAVLFAAVAACGGGIDPTGSNDSAPLPERTSSPSSPRPTSPASPERVADGFGEPSALALAGESVLVTSRSATLGRERVEAGALYVVDKRGGTPLLLSIDRQGASFDALASDGETAYVATSDSRILRVPVLGGETSTLAVLDAPAAHITTGGSYVYIASESGALARIAKNGGALEPIGTVKGSVRGLEVDGDAVYVALGAGGEAAAGIVRVAMGGTIKPLTSGREPCAMTRAGRSLYWTSVEEQANASAVATSEVLRVSLDGGTPAAVTKGTFRACALAVDSNSLYFATSAANGLPVRGDGTHTNVGLMRAPLTGGGEPVVLTEGVKALTRPGAVAVDATHLYWLTETAVLRLRK